MGAASTQLHGVCYNPTWTTWVPGASNTGPDAQLSDSDFFNDSFVALWDQGTDSNNNVYRNDLGTIAGGGFNLLRLYNWGPTRGWNGTVGTAHIGFLNRAVALGIRVIIPISNYFLSDDVYAWNGALPDAAYSFQSAPSAIQSALTQFLGSVTDPSTKRLHTAVHSFSVGNEIDINTLQGQGTSGIVEPSVRLARILWWIVNLQRLLSGGLGTALLTSPISNADQGNPGVSPRSYWFQAFVNGVTGGVTNLPQGTTGGTGTTFQKSFSGLGQYSWGSTWYYNSVNIYQYGAGLQATLAQYDRWTAQSQNNLNWPGQQFQSPLMLTEIGVARGQPSNSSNQESQFTTVTRDIALAIESYVKANASKLIGYNIYEFGDEVYIGNNFGMVMVEPTTYPSGNVLYTEATGPTVVSYATWPSINYPVDQQFNVTNTQNTSLLAALASIFRS
ncbi:MAG: hypothetical protein IPK82_26095 [Polyangiaceae bacterium]|nr:hypothetical protein [Polyangiaceae bacterium]